MRGRKHFENLPKETRNRLQKLFQSHIWTDDNGYIFNCLFKQEMIYFLRYEAIDVLNAIFLDQLDKENLSLDEVLKRNLISYDVTYNSIFRDIDEYISSLKTLKNDNVKIYTKMRIFSIFYILIKKVYTNENLTFNNYGYIFECLKHKNVVNEIVMARKNRYYLVNDNKNRIYTEYSLEYTDIYLRHESSKNNFQDEEDFSSFKNARLDYDVAQNKIVLNTTFDNLKTVNIARANYIGNSLLKDTMFNSLIDIFVDNIYDHQG